MGAPKRQELLTGASPAGNGGGESGRAEDSRSLLSGGNPTHGGKRELEPKVWSTIDTKEG